MSSSRSGIIPSLSILTGTQFIPLANGAFVMAGNENSSAKKESPGFPNNRKHFVTLSALPSDRVTALCGGEWIIWFRFASICLTSDVPAPSLYWSATRRLSAQSLSLNDVNVCDDADEKSLSVNALQLFNGLSLSIRGTRKSICEMGYKLWCGFPIVSLQ